MRKFLYLNWSVMLFKRMDTFMLGELGFLCYFGVLAMVLCDLV